MHGIRTHVETMRPSEIEEDIKAFGGDEATEGPGLMLESAKRRVWRVSLHLL